MSEDTLSTLVEALTNIIHLDPYENSPEPNEWGEADCFRIAQEIAHNALKKHNLLD